MNNFTASNGVEVQERPASVGGGYRFGPGPDMGVFSGVTSDQGKALREFFQAEADERLGRWRWSTPSGGLDFVVTANLPPCSDWDLTVTCEQSGQSMNYKRADDEGTYPGTNYFADAARAYFDAHPEPKPWHEAQPGEVWLLTIDRQECAAVTLSDPNGMFGGAKFETAERGLFGREAMAITEGRRIWPEVQS